MDGVILGFMRTHFKSLAIIVVFFIVMPAIFSFAAHISLQKIETEEQATSTWRWARLLARCATISPLFWSHSEEISQQADIALNQHYLTEVISGADGSATPDDHLDFLDSRPHSEYWTGARAQLQFHYGEFDQLNTAPISNETLLPVMAAALIHNDETRVKQISEFISQSEEIELNAGVSHLFVDTENDTPIGTLFALFESTDLDAIQALSILPEDYHALALEAALSNPNVDIAAIIQATKDIPDTAVGRPCLLLEIAKNNNDNLQVQDALALLSNTPQYPTRMTISQHGNCRPQTFEPNETLSTLQQQELWLYQAQSWLSKYQISKAQSAIKKAESITNPDAPNTTSAKALHLRVLARELAGDLNGAEKYAKRGIVYDKAIFTHHLGRIAMLRNQKTEGLRLLSSIGYYPLPEPLKTEFTELLAIARRLGGSQAKLNIQNKEIGHTLFDDDERFRVWLIEHIDNVTLPPKPSIVLPMLNAWRGVDRHGEFMLKTQQSASISPESIAIRAQLRLLQATIEGSDDRLSAAWKELVKARTWLSSIPHPGILALSPESFVLKVKQ